MNRAALLLITLLMALNANAYQLEIGYGMGESANLSNFHILTATGEIALDPYLSLVAEYQKRPADDFQETGEELFVGLRAHINTGSHADFMLGRLANWKIDIGMIKPITARIKGISGISYTDDFDLSDSETAVYFGAGIGRYSLTYHVSDVGHHSAYIQDYIELNIVLTQVNK